MKLNIYLAIEIQIVATLNKVSQSCIKETVPEVQNIAL